MYAFNNNNNNSHPKNDYGFDSTNPSSTSMCTCKVIIAS